MIIGGLLKLFLFPPALSKLVAAIIFISIGVIASFFCAIVDGIIASEFIVSITQIPAEKTGIQII